jgi:hypothetical protein
VIGREFHHPPETASIMLVARIFASIVQGHTAVGDVLDQLCHTLQRFYFIPFFFFCFSIHFKFIFRAERRRQAHCCSTSFCVQNSRLGIRLIFFVASFPQSLCCVRLQSSINVMREMLAAFFETVPNHHLVTKVRMLRQIAQFYHSSL